ncbi:disease resistance protein RGA2-like isoform X1 [Arachis stenosperma]|uniref:disease resistance protein RGA2-like isoform X1 n=1 Tax=Arachis stenosperma TaxID=217475 RepID=UPI0025AB6C45|nr:disease resistance protein RGA2-like isoform X1 [Arachis stenosperma]
MAESFIFSIAESLITKLASRAYQEASRVVGVYDDLQDLKTSLSYVKAVLLDAEQKQEQNHELREWLKQIKLIFYDAENLLDEVDCESLRKQLRITHKHKVGGFFSSSNPLLFRYKIAQRIKEIRKRLDRVAADRDKFGLQTIVVDKRIVYRREMTYSHVVESDVIGRDHDKGKIVKLLMEPSLDNNGGSKYISVIPIVGIGGLGKTTLAKLVFNDERITDTFSLKMWVCVSDDFDIKQLIIKIINAAIVSGTTSADALVYQQTLRDMDIEQLQYLLRNKLTGQKFLLVLDDVWSEDRAKWIQLRDLIKAGGAEGSKIVVTTRSRSVASIMGTVPFHDLQGLSSEGSFSLFVKWAFTEGEEEKYPTLVMIGKEIVRKCKGVPLAIRTLASLLFSKYEINDWESVRDDEIWNLPQKKDDILPALKLSYDHMPSYLRKCFAMFSLFPKDFEFQSHDVHSLWRAAGLLPPPSKNETSLDVANRYLSELMSRSFLENVSDVSTYYYFFIHDLVHDLAQYVASDDYQLISSENPNIPENVLHLSFTELDLFSQSFDINLSGVRTILFPFGIEKAGNEYLFTKWVSTCKYLRYLDLHDSTFETLPGSISKLKHLRFLSLIKNRRIRKLPASICTLQNLEELHLRGCVELETLPEKLRNLINLQRISITSKQSVLPEGDIAKLGSLKYLDIYACDNLESPFVEVKLSALRVLRIMRCKNLKSLPLDTHHFPQLEKFTLHACGNFELSDGDQDMNSVLRLKTIYFSMVMNFPYSLQGYSSTLQTLVFARCYELEALPEWLLNMTSLKYLHIWSCPRLMSLPNGIHRFIALEVLRIHDCPELYRKYQPHVGEYWHQISHIKHTDIRKTWRSREEDFCDNQD